MAAWKFHQFSIGHWVAPSIINRLTTIFFQILTDSGFLRKLECTYSDRLYNSVYCNWNTPRPPNHEFPFYIIKITHNGSIVYEGLTHHNYISLKEDLSPGGFYFVTVTPSSHGQSESFSTVIEFQDVGKILSLKLVSTENYKKFNVVSPFYARFIGIPSK